MDEIRITLETLYDILRNEKKREDLQKLEESFFLDVVSYMREKQALLDTKKESTEIFAAGEKEKLEYELRSIKRILKQIYELREKKIIDIALNKSRTGSDIIDTSAMLHEEKKFYEQTLQILDDYRHGILKKLFKGDLPDLSIGAIPQINNYRERDGSVRHDTPELLSSADSGLPEAKENTLVTIKFTQPVPSFVWKDMKVYGPFEPGESTEIFPEVAELLVRKGRAVKV